ncbi:MAG: aromatic amino acid hydroxylase [Bacteroidota bacterium]
MSLLAKIESNEMIDRLPDHLKQFIKPQHYSDYSPIDQAVWRYVMHKNVAFLSQVAHGSYVDGLKKTGISTEYIPSMYGMNRILREIGWAAVAVDGFIPPNTFMEFQAYKVLVIAADIRQLEHIEYTPSPDIIHEAAGHAPMIANPDYAEYLRRLGAIGAKTIWSHYDGQLYEAIRKLSILKEAVGVDPETIQKATEEVEALQLEKPEPSEMSKLRNLQWWTVEYGLIGSLDKPKIYGAGLLSSIGESEWCLRPDVKKIPFSIDAADVSFDITQPQPQLYVTPDFPYLMDVLEQFAETTALRTGGAEGIQKLINSKMTGTIELNNGLQISGLFHTYKTDSHGNLSYIETLGKTAFAYREKELIGHGVTNYPDGIKFPFGKIEEIIINGERRRGEELTRLHPSFDDQLTLHYQNGFCVEGRYKTSYRHIDGKLFFLELSNCRISENENIIQKNRPLCTIPIGESIVSAFAGSSDVNSFPGLYSLPKTETPHPPKSKSRLELENLYQSVRTYREKRTNHENELMNIFETIKVNHPGDWLVSCEILELIKNEQNRKMIKEYLSQIIDAHPELNTLIREGIKMAETLYIHK